MDFSDRTDALAEKLGVRLDKLPDVLGFSRASLFNYRSGKTEPSSKALRKLLQAEVRAGLASIAHNGSVELTYESATERLPKVCDLETQVAEIQKLLIRMINRSDKES